MMGISMKQLLFTCAIAALLPFAAGASTVDVMGGPEGAQTVHHCGFLPTKDTNYTDSAITTSIVEHKLVELGFLHHPGNGVYTKADQQAVRAFQADAGIKVDGVVGGVTAQRLAWFSHPSANVHRCYREATPLS
jgi:hypothetical protein